MNTHHTRLFIACCLFHLLQTDLAVTVYIETVEHYHAANRTNNRVEGWHSKLNCYVKKSHPSMSSITELKKEQAATELTVHRASLGAVPPERRPEYIRLDQQVDRLKTKFEGGEYTVEEYLGSLRRIVHNY